jgi:hypothetical protein
MARSSLCFRRSQSGIALSRRSKKATVMGFGHVAEFVGDHVVDGIDRRLHETAVQ